MRFSGGYRRGSGLWTGVTGFLAVLTVEPGQVELRVRPPWSLLVRPQLRAQARDVDYALTEVELSLPAVAVRERGERAWEFFTGPSVPDAAARLEAAGARRLDPALIEFPTRLAPPIGGVWPVFFIAIGLVSLLARLVWGAAIDARLDGMLPPTQGPGTFSGTMVGFGTLAVVGGVGLLAVRVLLARRRRSGQSLSSERDPRG